MRKRFYALDAFRGLAALVVICFHFHVKDTFTESLIVHHAHKLMELFFTLSGFVFAHCYGSQFSMSFKDFLKGRLFRIYPLHFFTFSLVFLHEILKLFISKLGFFQFNTAPFTEHKAIVEIIPNLLLLHGWVPSIDAFSFNSPSWTISIEFYIYLIFFVTVKLFKNSRAIAWTLISVLAFYILNTYPEEIRMFIFRGLSCFFAGTLSYFLYDKIKDSKLGKSSATCMELVLILCGSYIYFMEGHISYFYISIFYIPFVLMFSLEKGYFSQFLCKGIFQKLGEISYSMYLMHFPIILYLVTLLVFLDKVFFKTNMARYIDGHFHFDLNNTIANNLFMLMTLAVIIAISLLTNKHVERNPRFKIKKK